MKVIYLTLAVTLFYACYHVNSAPIQDVVRSDEDRRTKRDNCGKVILDKVNFGTQVFAANNVAMALVVPNPVTVAVAVGSGVVAEITGTIAMNME